MKPDYIFLKRVLNTIIEYDSHCIDTRTLAEDVKASDDVDEDAYLGKLFGHLQLLKDNQAIEILQGQSVGVIYNLNTKGYMQRTDCLFRLTSKGYDLTDTLNKKRILDKLKDLSLSAVLYLGRIAVEKSAEKLIDKIEVI